MFDIDMLGEGVVRAYYAAAPETPVVSRRGEEFHAEPALPGWSMKVDELFPVT